MKLVSGVCLKISSLAFLAIFLLIAGCLDFGSDTVTENPTSEQLNYCEAIMHIKDDLLYRPLGLKIIGSGIDDAVWFCFQTEETDPAEIFDADFVHPDSLHSSVSIYTPEDIPLWWNAADEDLFGGVFSFSGGRYMTVGIDRQENDCTVYIFWNES